MKNFILALIMFSSSLLFGQEGRQKAVILGSSYAKSCSFLSTEKVEFLNHSVADFTSGQLLWTINHGVIDHQPDFCFLQTGALDALLGIHPDTVVQNLSYFHQELKPKGIRLVFIEDFPIWNNGQLDEKLSEIHNSVKLFCTRNQVPFIEIETGEKEIFPINAGKSPILTENECNILQSAILKFFANEGN